MALFRMRPIRVRGSVRWDPWREMEELRREMERIGERGLERPPASEADAAVHAPDLDLYDTGAAFVVRIDLPGVKREDLDISFEGGVFTIRGRRAAAEGKEETLLHCERPVGRFARTIDIPGDVDVERVQATLVRGVLEMVLPKAKAAAPKKVAVTVGDPE